MLRDRFLFFFFKQKTAYDMRISDWSSDVCSSDLKTGTGRHPKGILPSTWLDQTGAADRSRLFDKPSFPLADCHGQYDFLPSGVLEIGRASCRERVCQYV